MDSDVKKEVGWGKIGNWVCWNYREELGEVVVSEEEVEVAGVGAEEEEVGDEHDLEVVGVVVFRDGFGKIRGGCGFAGGG